VPATAGLDKCRRARKERTKPGLQAGHVARFSAARTARRRFRQDRCFFAAENFGFVAAAAAARCYDGNGSRSITRLSLRAEDPP